MPRERVVAPGHSRERSLGWLCLAWWEHFVVHGPGDVPGRSLRRDDPDGLPLDDELAGFSVDCYALDQSGKRLYTSAFLSRSKGRDKSGHAARFGLFEALGPARFAGWARGGEVYRDPWDLGFEYEYVAGEPMGRPVTHPFLRCLATEEDQAGNVYDAIYFNLTEGPLAAVPGLDPGLTRTYLPGGGEIVPSTAANASKDGGKETWVDFDETHLYVLRSLREMYNTIRRNLGLKRKDAEPWSLETSTMYAPGEGSVAEETHKLAQQIAAGKARASRLLFDHREAFADLDLSDDESIFRNLREVLGPFAEVRDLQRMRDEIVDPRNDEVDVRRFAFNLPTPRSHKAVPPALYDAGARPGDPLRPGEKVTLGFDGSRSQDGTALRVCRLRDRKLFHERLWVPADYPDHRVPRREVDEAMRAAFAAYDVVYLYADPFRWQDYLDVWAALWPGRVVEFPTNVETRMDRAIERFLTALRAGELIHDGHPTSADHARHAVLAKGKRKPPREGDDGGLEQHYLRVVKRRDGDLIDDFVAGILAYEAAGQAIEDGALLEEPAPAAIAAHRPSQQQGPSGVFRPAGRLNL